MKSVICMIMVLAGARALRAADFESIRWATAFEISDIRAESVTPIPFPAAPENSGYIFKGSFCWQRRKEPNAERMGMPFSFCVNSMQITGGLFEKPFISISGAGLNGTFPLKVGPPCDGLYKATAVVFQKSNGASCSAGENAYIEFSVLADARGMIVAEPFLKAFYGSTSDVCHSQFQYAEIKYAFTAQ